MTTPWNGFPHAPERDSDGHVIRLSEPRTVVVLRWDAAEQVYRDRRGRPSRPEDFALNGDEYLGRIVPPEEIAALVDAEREAILTEVERTWPEADDLLDFIRARKGGAE